MNFRLCLASILLLAAGGVSGQTVDFSDATVVAPPGLSGPEKKAVRMLVEEVEKRTQLRWPVASSWPAKGAVVAVGTRASLANAAGELNAQPAAPGAEGYRIRVSEHGGAPAALVVGNDARGVLFGVGKLLRSLRMEKGSARLPADLKITTAPKYPIRGHQLGNRTLNNSADAWKAPMWEQYFRDLAVFGANSVALLPP